MEAYSAAYEKARWRGVLEQQADGFDGSRTTYVDGAYVNARLGRKDIAFDYLEKAYKRREWSFAYINVEPRLDPLRNDPRFADLVRRVQTRDRNR